MAARFGFDSIPKPVAPISGRYVKTATTTSGPRRHRTPITLTASEWVESFINIKNANDGTVGKIDFSERQYLRRLYDTPSRKVIFMTSRQTEKSTTVGNITLARSLLRRNYNSLFVSPSAMQTVVFSRARIDDTIDISPTLHAMKGDSFNILEKNFLNGSRVYLRYAFLNADRIRGLSVNSLFGDEIQDLLSDVMPVIEETTSHHKDPTFVYSGTPKTFDNTIEKYWSGHSTQSEWVIPCERHGTPKDPTSWHWNILGPNNIGLTGPVCSRPNCKKPIAPDHPMAHWNAMNPDAEWEGLRICRLMVPWFIKDPAKWDDFVIKTRERYEPAKFYNEVLALSFDGGSKPLSRAEMVRACDSRYPNTLETAVKISKAGSAVLYAGIDWGEGTENSYTVMTIGSFCREDSAFQVLYSLRFTGQLADPDAQIAHINKIVSGLRIRLIGTDYGGGFHPNKRLTNVYGPARILQFQYAGRASAKLNWKPLLARYIAFRTPVMADIINAIKSGKKIRLPSYDTYKTPHVDDYLALRAEYSNTLRMIQYTKARNIPDDTFHSLVFCMLAAMRENPRPDIMAPIKDKSSDEARAASAEEAAMDELYRQAAEQGVDI